MGGVHSAEDNVFTTTVATSGSLPEHMLVNQVQFKRSVSRSNGREIPTQTSSVLETKPALTKPDIYLKRNTAQFNYLER